MRNAIEKSNALATEINLEHSACETAARDAVAHAVRAGELLAEAKTAVKHGEWSDWIATHCDFSDRTAQTYMRVARELPKLDGPKAQRAALLSMRGIVKLLEPDREAESERGLREVVASLRAIRDQRLFRDTHDTFYDYLADQFPGIDMEILDVMVNADTDLLISGVRELVPSAP